MGSAAQAALFLALGEISTPLATAFDVGDSPPEVSCCADNVPKLGDLCGPPSEPKKEVSAQEKKQASDWWLLVPAVILAGSLGMYAWRRRRDKLRKKVLDEIISAISVDKQPGGKGELPLP